MDASRVAPAFYLLSAVLLLVGGTMLALYIASVAGLPPDMPAWLAAVGVAFLVVSVVSYALYTRYRRRCPAETGRPAEELRRARRRS